MPIDAMVIHGVYMEESSPKMLGAWAQAERDAGPQEIRLTSHEESDRIHKAYQTQHAFNKIKF